MEEVMVCRCVATDMRGVRRVRWLSVQAARSSQWFLWWPGLLVGCGGGRSSSVLWCGPRPLTPTGSPPQ